MNRLVVVLLSAILVVLLLVLWQIRPDSVSPYVPIAVQAMQQPAVTIDLPEPRLDGDATHMDGEVAAPWASDSASAVLALPTVAADGELLTTERRERMNALRQRVLSAIEGGKIDAQALDAALADLEKERGPRLGGGVSLPVIRHNLKVAMQMQALAGRITDSAGEGASNPAVADRIQEQVRELQALQAQLRLDVIDASVAEDDR